MQVTRNHEAPTEKQIGFATMLAHRKGYRFLGDAEKACFGKRKIGGLHRSDISRLIDWLQA